MPTEDFSPSKLEELVLFVLQNSQRELGGIELAKILYLIDVEKMRFLGTTLTGEEYVRAEKGPLVRGFQHAIRRLLGHEVAVSVQPSSGKSRWDKNCHSVGPAPRFQPDLEAVDQVIATRVLYRVSKDTPRQLEKRAYDTEPMKAIMAMEAKSGEKYGGSLNFSLVKRDASFSRWQANRRKREKSEPEYEKFLEEERAEIDEVLASLG